MADYTIEPWGDVRGDLHAAQVVSTLANLHRPKGRRPFTLDECRLHFHSAPPTPDQSPTTIMAHLERFFARYEHAQDHGDPE